MSSVNFSPHIPLTAKVTKDNKIVDADNPFESKPLHTAAALASARVASHSTGKRKYDNKGNDNTNKKLSKVL